MDSQLIKKYNVAGPRYTSYPTVPYWDASTFNIERWKEKLIETFSSGNDISLYVHLPFCESLCTYCGCNTRITVNHAVEEPYIDTVLKEWQLYLDLLPARPKIKELHLGGGTPTFFSSANLEKLIKGLLIGTDPAYHREFSFEGHPNHTSVQQLQSLYNLGFRRVSFGIQDFDPVVQHIIHREQSYDQIKNITEAARATGYKSVNYDLIYGLPLQTPKSIRDTITKVNALKPDRIAFYSYAHVPWMKKGQRRFTEADLPNGEEKRALYELGRKMLEAAGYIEIGMDHFALKNDALYKAVTHEDGVTLHRNFMGYTTASSALLIGLGVSAISDSWNAFSQNVKVVEEYTSMVNAGLLPVCKGHILTEEDMLLRRHILSIMCNFHTFWNKDDMVIEEALLRLSEPLSDGLITLSPHALTVTEKGKAFLRNICMALDARLWRNQPSTQLFSATV